MTVSDLSWNPLKDAEQYSCSHQTSEILCKTRACDHNAPADSEGAEVHGGTLEHLE